MPTCRILLTGGLGYIGAHTAVELIEAGFDVLIADNLSNAHLEVLDGIERITGVRPAFERLDLRDAVVVRELLRRYPVDGCIHLAAHKSAGESVLKPLAYYDNNVTALVSLLGEFLRRGMDRLVFSSSSSVYGNAPQLPITEEHAAWPAESPYGTSKIIGEQVLRDASRAHGLNVVVLRCFNPIGAHPSAEIGELSLGGPLNLVTLIAQSAAGRRGPLQVFGSDHPTPDGTCVRDYVHVVDVARAHVAALDRLIAGTTAAPFEVFNVGTGHGSSVLEAITGFERATGRPVRWSFAPRRLGDPVQAYADTTRARQQLFWSARKSLDDAMLDVWAWQTRRDRRPTTVARSLARAGVPPCPRASAA